MKHFSPIALACMLALAGCSKEEGTGFDYDVNLLYGKWRVTHVMQNTGSYLDVTTSVAESVFEPTYATFNSDGTYSGSGEFGNGSGTYKAVGKTIVTYIGGEEYLRYNIVSLSGTKAELEMYENDAPSETLSIKTENLGISFKVPYSPDH